MNKQEVLEHSHQYYINDALETIARIDAEKTDDIHILQQNLEKSACNGEDNICIIYLQKMLSTAKFSSDYIDIAKILQKYTGLQEFLSLADSLDLAKKSAKTPGDWLEIQQFADNYDEK